MPGRVRVRRCTTELLPKLCLELADHARLAQIHQNKSWLTRCILVLLWPLTLMEKFMILLLSHVEGRDAHPTQSSGQLHTSMLAAYCNGCSMLSQPQLLPLVVLAVVTAGAVAQPMGLGSFH